jgi:class 3 adenylate cyclase
MSGIRQWLEGLGLGQYAQAFEANDIDLDLLPQVDDQALKDIGVGSTGHRLRLRAAIAALTPGTSSTQGNTDTSVAAQLGAPSAERRQLTVMFCDLVGSTELAHKLDPEALRDLMRGYQQACGAVIERYDGHVAQYLGDGLMVYFGWPRAHEDDAERAVRASLEIVQAVKQVAAAEVLRVRIGIATGPVVVGETGAGDASVPKVAVGETPNLAARLQGLAQADQIVIGASTHQLLGAAFEYEGLGQHVLKGVVEPVRAWRVQSVKQAEGRFEARHAGQLTPFVGREEEIALLLRRWKQAKEGEGQVVLLSGEPGIGKSRILRALRDRLEAEGAQSLRFQCSPYYVNSAFWPSIDSFERALKFGRDESDESELGKLEALIVGHYGRPLSDVRFVAEILSIPCDARYGPLSITPQKDKDETIRTLVDLVAASARRQPGVVLFEDLHWADPTTLEVLDALIERVRYLPLLMLLTHRPEFSARWAGHGHITSLNLAKLSRAQSAALVSRVTGGKALPPGLLEQIVERTDGVPLFVEELTKSILESGALTDAGDRYESAPSGSNIIIPTTLRDSLMARLDRLTPVKEIAQIAAAIGREFSYELLAAVVPMSQAQLDGGLDKLTESGLAFRRGTPPEATYTFKHALVQDAAYDSLLKSRRQEIHRKIAGALEERHPQLIQTEPEVLAHHYTQAGQLETAIPLWQKAGELAIKRMAFAEAINDLGTGLGLVVNFPHGVQRDTCELDLRSLLGTATLALKGWPAQELTQILQPALPLAMSLRRDEALLPIVTGLYWNVLTQGRAAESMRWAEQMLQAATTTGKGDLLITAHMLMSATNFWMGEYRACLEHRDKVEALYSPVQHAHLTRLLNHDPKTLVGSYAANVLWMLGYPDCAASLCDEKNAHGRARGHPFDQGFALTLGSEVYYLRGEPHRLRECAEECERIGRENSMPVLWAMLAPLRTGMADILAGRLVEGTRAMRSGLDVWEGMGGRINTPMLKTAYATGVARVGDVDGALQMVDAMLDQIERPGWDERLHYPEVLRTKGWMLELKVDTASAERFFLASLAAARKQQAKSWELRSASSLARQWQSQGKRREARDLLAPVYGWFTEGLDTKDLKEAKALLEELAG